MVDTMTESQVTQQSLDELYQNLEIARIQLISFRSELLSAPSDETVHRVGYKVLGYELIEDKLAVQIEMEVLGHNKKQEDRYLVMKAGYLGIYQVLNREVALEENNLNFFSQTNVPYNIFPYFRELIDNQAARMCIGPLTLPLFKPGQIGQMKTNPASKTDEMAADG